MTDKETAALQSVKSSGLKCCGRKDRSEKNKSTKQRGVAPRHAIKFTRSQTHLPTVLTVLLHTPALMPVLHAVDL